MENLLTHDEIWDDSALVNAWDEALQEYKKYHSIDATGENKQKLIRQAEEAEMRDAPPLNLVQEGEENIIDNSYEAFIEDGEVSEEEMEQKETTVPHAAVPEADSVAEQEGGYEQPQTSDLKSGSAEHEQHSVGAGDQSDTRLPCQTRAQPPPPPFPQNFVGDVKDNEALRNLMMSWYFAGYYTGLYEGQQQRASQPQP